MAILTSKNGTVTGFADTAEEIEMNLSREGRERPFTKEDRLRTARQEIGTALFINRHLRLEVNQLAQTLSSLLRDTTQQENTLQTALRAVNRALKETETDGDEDE
jgi:hypothetical protein